LSARPKLHAGRSAGQSVSGWIILTCASALAPTCRRRSEGFEAAAAVIRIGRDQQNASPSFRCPATPLLQVRAWRYSDLILLDLNLPNMDGREVLAQIKGDTELKVISTLILITSDARADIIRSYQLQANVYLTKLPQLDAFESLVKSINEFWLMNAKLPLGAQGA
jgi:CheY-like chemotaxis protein